MGIRLGRNEKVMLESEERFVVYVFNILGAYNFLGN